MIGANPKTKEDIDFAAGADLRAFILLRAKLIRDHDWISNVNLDTDYGYTPNDAAALQAAFTDIWGVIQPMDMSRVNKVAGLGFG